MKYLLDTNIISELRKHHANENVINWVMGKGVEELFISCITIGELRCGVLKKSKKDPLAGDALDRWLQELIREYEDRILLVNTEICEKWGELLAIDNTNAIDALIAAQAISNNMTLVTRNMKHFKSFEVKLLNPFD